MLGSLITRPLRIATRSAQITLHGAHQAIEIAEGVIGLVAARMFGQDAHRQDGRAGAPAEPPVWTGPAASSTSSPSDRPARAATRRRPRAASGRRAGASAAPAPADSTETPPTPTGPTEAPATPTGPTEAPPAPADDDSGAGEDVRDVQSVAEIVNAEPAEPPMPEAEHISEEPELVEEVADPGAEYGAGAQLRIAEPWDGYRTLKAADVIDRLSSVSSEVLVAVELYEQAGRNRKSVVAAVRRALKQANPPR
jgi:hypothetical protein